MGSRVVEGPKFWPHQWSSPTLPFSFGKTNDRPINQSMVEQRRENGDPGRIEVEHRGRGVSGTESQERACRKHEWPGQDPVTPLRRLAMMAKCRCRVLVTPFPCSCTCWIVDVAMVPGRHGFFRFVKCNPRRMPLGGRVRGQVKGAGHGLGLEEVGFSRGQYCWWPGMKVLGEGS